MSDGPLSFRHSWEGFLPPDAVLMTKRGAPPVERLSSGVRIGFEAPDLTDPAGRALFDKILAALELPPADVAFFSHPPEGFHAPVLVRFVFAESDAKTVGAWAGGVLTTYSLRAMLSNPALKKLVWAHLKDAAARARG